MLVAAVAASITMLITPGRLEPAVLVVAVMAPTLGMARLVLRTQEVAVALDAVSAAQVRLAALAL